MTARIPILALLAVAGCSPDAPRGLLTAPVPETAVAAATTGQAPILGSAATDRTRTRGSRTRLPEGRLAQAGRMAFGPAVEDWHGVETNEAGRVTSLISRKGLTGAVPPEIGA